MLRKSVFPLILILVFTFSSGFSQIIQEQTSTRQKLSYDQLLKSWNGIAYYHVPIGIGEDYPEESTTLEIIRKDMEFLKATGTRLLRISFGWDAIEEQKGKFNWLFWDDFVKMAVEEYGITLVPYVCYMPKWNSTGEQDTLNYWCYPPKDYNEFGVFMAQLVNRYKKWIKSWELWNEPDITVYWRGTAEDLAKLVKIGSAAVRSADPKAIVVLAGLAYRPEFTRQLFRDYGISPYVDVVNIHNYYETWVGNPIEWIVNYINEIRNIIKQYGNNQSIWTAEVGYSTWRMTKSRVSEGYTAYYDYEHSPEYQATELFKTLTLIIATGQVSAITWYRIKDLPPAEIVIGDNNNRNLGLEYYDYKPKPAMKTLLFFHQLFAGKYKDIDDQVTIPGQDTSQSFFRTLQRENGDVIVVGWLRTDLPKHRDNDTSGTVSDTRKKNFDIKMPVTLKGKVTSFSPTGEPREFKEIAQEDNYTTLKNVTLQGGKIIIIEIKK